MRILVSCAVVVCLCAFVFAADSDPEQQISARSKAFITAWDKHDAKALAEFYAESADLVIAKGETFSTRNGIEQALSDGFDGDLRDTTLTESIEKVRLIKPDVAIVDSEVQIKRGGQANDADKFHVVNVLVKQDGKWLTETTRVVKYTQE